MPISTLRPVVIASIALAAAFAQPEPRAVVSLDKSWLIYPLPDFKLWPSQPKLSDTQIRQLVCPKPGKGWQTVQLPDDYVVRGEFTPEPNASMLAGGAVCPLGGRECAPPDGSPPQGKPGALNRPGRNGWAGHGYLPTYPAWYRRTLVLPSSDKGKEIWLDFGGIYRDAIIFINGKFVEQHASGYTGFRINVTSAVHFGEDNTIAVFVDPRWFEGWWYEGGGIYRHVKLIVTDPLQVAPWGSFVETEVSGTKAQLTIRTSIRNHHSSPRKFTLLSRVLDPSGKVAASVSSDEQLASNAESTFTQRVDLPDAQLWSLDHPNLYRLSTTIRVDGTAVDNEAATFGVRTLRFDPEQGFFLNGKHIELKGVCDHHDFPGVGIAAPDNLWRWRLAKHQEMGVNTYRTAHNPHSDALYDAADEMGILVMDETRHFGDTYFPKAVADTPYSDLSDLKAMVMQHRHHPSIIMWSLANEEGQGPTPYGAKMFAAMKEAVKKIDPTRPTTGAVNGGYKPDGYISVEDLLGMNYHNAEFAKNHATFPKLMIFGSEDANAKTSRGTPVASRPEGLTAESGEPWKSWLETVENRFVAGQFIWTGFDYRGEPNPYSWPAVTSQTGARDLAGFAKPVYYYWRAWWNDQPSVYFFPTDWNSSRNEAGKTVHVRCFSNCERVELSLNGKSLGSQQMPRNMYLDWDVPYSPGKITAFGFDHGQVAATFSAETTGVPAALRLTSELPQLVADGQSVMPVRVEVLDAHGRVVSDSDIQIDFSVFGPGSLAGVANGNPASHESNVGVKRRAFRGLALALVRAGELPGVITLQANAAGLPTARIEIPTQR